MNEGTAIDIVLARMDTHPEEFYGESQKWAFIYKEYFRDIMTENEKAALHTKLKAIRRAELTGKVLETITADDDAKTELDSEVNRIMASKFGSVTVKREGTKVSY